MKPKITGNESNNFQYASFGKRLKAFAFDYLVILAYIILLAGVNYGIILAGGGLEKIAPIFESVIIKDLIAFITLILPVMLYFTLQESSAGQATWGKQKVGLRVVDSDGNRLSPGRAFLRSGIKFLPWQIAHTSFYHVAVAGFGNVLPPISLVGFSLTYLLVGVYVVSTLVSKKHRTPYDWAAGSYVIAE